MVSAQGVSKVSLKLTSFWQINYFNGLYYCIKQFDPFCISSNSDAFWRFKSTKEEIDTFYSYASFVLSNLFACFVTRLCQLNHEPVVKWGKVMSFCCREEVGDAGCFFQSRDG